MCNKYHSRLSLKTAFPRKTSKLQYPSALLLAVTRPIFIYADTSGPTPRNRIPDLDIRFRRRDMPVFPTFSCNSWKACRDLTSECKSNIPVRFDLYDYAIKDPAARIPAFIPGRLVQRIPWGDTSLVCIRNSFKVLFSFLEQYSETQIPEVCIILCIYFQNTSKF